MKNETSSPRDLLQKIEELQTRLAEAEDTLQAIRAGEVDAILVAGAEGEKVFTLQGAERPYRILIESLNEGALTLLPDGTIAYSNSRFVEMVRTPLEDVIGSSIFRFLSPQQEASFKSLLQQTGSEQTKGSKAEFLLLGSGGAVTPAQLSVSLLDEKETPGFCLLATHLTEKTQAEVALHESQTLTTAIVDSTSDLIWSVDPETFGLLTFNSAPSNYFLQRRGIRLQTGLRPEDLLPTPDLANVWRGFYQGALSGGSFTTVYDAVGSNILQLTLSLLKRDGKVFGISVFGKDITERQRTETALQESETAFRTLAEVVPQMVWMCTPDGSNIYFNPRWVDYTGMTLAESYGRGWNTPFHPDDKQPAWDGLEPSGRDGWYVQHRVPPAAGGRRLPLVSHSRSAFARRHG